MHCKRGGEGECSVGQIHSSSLRNDESMGELGHEKEGWEDGTRPPATVKRLSCLQNWHTPTDVRHHQPSEFLLLSDGAGVGR